MKSKSRGSQPARAAIVFFLLLAGAAIAQARTAKDFFQNSELSDGNNYSPAGTPTASNDVRLTSSATVLTLNGTNLSVGSLNQTNNLSYTIANNNPGTANSVLFLGGGDGINTIGGNPADVIYLGCATCSLTFQGPNASDDGIGTLKLTQNAAAQFNVAQSGASLNIGTDLTIDGQLTKVGAGTMNFSNQTIAGVPGSVSKLTINEGIVNFLSGAVVGGRVILNVNNPNTGAGTDVTVNLQRSESFEALGGTIATPSSGTNTAKVNLIGTGTNLGIIMHNIPFSYSGDIAGQGSVSIITSTMGSFTQTFAGNNTYSGTTTVGSWCTLVIDGNTSGQDNYTMMSIPSALPSTLAGSGTIGLNANGTVTIAGNLAPGPASSGIGTLHVNTSGTGGVILGNGSVYVVQVGSAGVSDQLAITGGSIDLTSSSDTLSLSSLAGAFDGTDYTIATFTQNLGGGTFNTVQGLPSGYAVQYNPTSIKLVALPQPLQLTGAVSRKMHGTLGPFDVNLLTTDPVECRSSGGNHTLVITFSNQMVSGSASVTTGTGTVSGAPAFSAKTMTIDLVGVSDMQKLVVTLHNVTDRFSQVLPDTPITVNMLIGDTTGNKSVTSSDVAEIKFRSGAVPTASTFRDDVTANGTISASDISLVKLHSGASVPP
jgi:hypothetical protein